MGSKDSNSRKKKILLLELFVLLLVICIFKMTPRDGFLGIQSGMGGVVTAGGDLNRDGVINLEDLELFSKKWLKQEWQDVDWCQYIDSGDKNIKRLGGLREFIIEYFQCGVIEPPEPPTNPLDVVHENKNPIRICWDDQGFVYVTDSVTGSVFIYDYAVNPNTPTSELKGLDKPLGIAVDSAGNIYVGNNGRDNVEVYSPQGDLLRTIGQDTIKMPNDIAIDQNGFVYVVDSISDCVFVFDSNGLLTNTITDGNLKFPVAITIEDRDDGTGNFVKEIYVADQGNFMIKVFDINGDLLRSLGSKVTEGFFGMGITWKGKFIRLAALDFDSLDRLHALDIYMCNIQILDPDTGAYINSYGDKGTAPGAFHVPLGIQIKDDKTAVSDYGNKRIQFIDIP